MLLTTQYLEEADQLADRIAVIDHGKVIAEGTSHELKASVGSGVLHIRLADSADREKAVSVLSEAAGSEAYVEADPAALAVQIEDAGRAAHAVSQLAEAGIGIASFSMGQPTLDEVFFALTGRPAEPQEQSPGEDGTTEKTP